MKNISFRLFAATVLLILGISSIGLGQRNPTDASAKPAETLLATLPPSDAIALINVSRVFSEALPKLLAENPTKLAQITGELAKFKTQTGLDPRSFDQIALGFSYKYPRQGITKISSVALARGTFNAGAMVAAGRLAANGKYREEKYLGKTIYIFTLEQQLRLFGLWNLKVGDLAVVATDSKTLALGSVDAVRGALDAARTVKSANPLALANHDNLARQLIALASRDPNAVMGFGGNLSPLLLENLSLSNDMIAREITAVRQVYGTLGMTSTDVELMLEARTVDAASAKNLSDTVEGLKQLGGLFINRLTAAKGTLARSALNNLKVTTSSNVLQIKTAVAQSQVAPLVGGN